MTDAEISKKQSRFSMIWIVPVTAIVAGLWMVAQHYYEQGPVIEVTFSTGEGLKPGDTRVKRLSVDLGIVEQVYLNDDFNNVTAVIRLDKDAKELLRDNTQFWVVKPRVGTSGISGLSTLLSGAYIEILPGNGEPNKKQFKGLDDIPITPLGTPGAHLKLIADGGGSISVGSPVLYNGYRVGRVEKAVLSEVDSRIHYKVFVEAPYHDLVSANTRFWNASGFSVTAGANGVSVDTESLEAILTGGIAFGLPKGVAAGPRIDDEQVFDLYPDYESISKQPYRYFREYILLFDASIRGLSAGAPVEYRGIRIGSVLQAPIDLMPEDFHWSGEGHLLVPVLIRIDPGRLAEDSEEHLGGVDRFFMQSTKNGMRATLKSGSLLTGALYVSLDFYDEHKAPDGTEYELAVIGDYTVLPTIETGLVQLEHQVSSILEKIQTLPLEGAVLAATSALDGVGETVIDLNRLLEDPSMKALPEQMDTAVTELRDVLAGLSPESGIYVQLESTLDELQVTLNSSRDLLNSLETKPSSLIFSSAKEPDRVPTPEN